MFTARRSATGLAAVARGLAHRGGSTLMILLVAVAAAAAAAAGPFFYQAAKVSVMRDLIGSGSPIDHGYEANLSGPLNGVTVPLSTALKTELDRELGPANVTRLFGPPVLSLAGTGTYPPENATFALAWRSGMCAHLEFTGTCPRERNQVLVSRSEIGVTHWKIGQKITGTRWPALTITGIYQPPAVNSPYWQEQSSTLFPVEATAGGNALSAGTGFDALLTARSTLADASAAEQGQAYADVALRMDQVQPADIARLRTGMSAAANSVSLSGQNIILSTNLPATASRIEANWRTVAIPVTLITIQVLLLGWLLLFLAVTDAIEARAPEVALAKLRGHGRMRTLTFGLSEPITLLVVALPVGSVVGWAAASALDGALLRAGTPTGMTVLGWAAAAGATAGGIVAVVLAARRALRRGVVEEFRHSGRRATDRGWVVDSILLTGSIAGLLELLLTGRIGSASHNVLGLLVPGLLGMAVAVVASRLLPLACRAGYARTGRRGGLAVFLAIRHIARRPGGTRTTIVLATAFALVSFAIAAWTVSLSNYRLVGGTQVGAPTVVTVVAPPGRNLGAIVERIDPGGRRAAVVDSYVSLSGSTVGDVVLAVDPSRFAQVAFWPASLSREPLSDLARKLDPPAPPPVILTGDAMRLTIAVHSLSAAGEQVSANVTTGASPVPLGSLPRHGTVTLTGPLVGCPCVLQSLALTVPGRRIAQEAGMLVSGKLTISGMDVHNHGRWQPVPVRALSSAAAWRADQAHTPPDVISAGPTGVNWAFSGVPGTQDPTLDSVNRPVVMPALIPEVLTRHRTGTLSGAGLDGKPLALKPVAPVAAVPGAPGNGVIVDRHYAELAAGEDLTYVTQQVWLAEGARQRIVPALKAAGVRVDSVQTISTVTAALGRRGPGLASLLFLADAAAAALLAVGAAILGLYLSARRRRYEYAALEASGVRRAVLRRALLAEVAVVLGFGMAAGVASGVGAAALVLRTVPEFVSSPAAPPLVYAPPVTPLASLLAVAAGLLIATSVAASLLLIRSVRPDQLREAPA